MQSSEIFARPSKQITGKWQLFEYYFEQGKELHHITGDQLKAGKQHWNIEFAEEEKYLHNSNLSVSLISAIDNGVWSISRNFVTLINPHDFRNNVEFQFAIEKGDLKLLKKDKLGNIEFFGFFKRLDSN